MKKLNNQSGAALLAAMLTVTLVASLAATAVWQQWRSIEVEIAQRSRIQSGWILTGALDWSRLILREDANSGGPDHLAEPWAVPLQEARLSTFLSADQNNNANSSEEDVQQAFLSGEINDLQGRLNIQNLIKTSAGSSAEISEVASRTFVKLFELLGLPKHELTLLQDNLLQVQTRDNQTALLPAQRLEQLLDYGLSAQTLAVLRPFVTFLPNASTTPVNLNTAPAEVVYASVPKLDLATAQRFVNQRSQNQFKTVDAAKAALGESGLDVNGSTHSISSNYFEIVGQLRLDQHLLQERTIVERSSSIFGRPQVNILSRERGFADHPNRQITQTAQ